MTLQPPDGVIIGEPSGWQGITLGYKGTLSVDYRLARASGHGAGDRVASAEDAVAFWNRLVDHASDQNGDRRPLASTPWIPHCERSRLRAMDLKMA